MVDVGPIGPWLPRGWVSVHEDLTDEDLMWVNTHMEQCGLKATRSYRDIPLHLTVPTLGEDAEPWITVEEIR